MLDNDSEEQLFEKMTLQDAVRQLTQVRRIIVALRSAGYTQQDCGVILGLTGVAVGLIHRRAIEQIRQFMAWYERKSYDHS